MIVFSAKSDYVAKSNTVAGTVYLGEFVSGKAYPAKKAWINIGGWQSWNPGIEVAPGKKQPSLYCHVIKQWNNYLEFPGTTARASKNYVLGQFVVYLRWNEKYLVLASAGNIDDELPPVQFVINRKKNMVDVEICDIGKEWKTGDVLAKIECFTADSYFQAREKLTALFGTSDSSSEFYSSRFNQIKHLGKTSLGWESWYNRYANINQELILEDLQALGTTKNYLNLIEEKSGQKGSTVFQIDDGWEKELGNWECRCDRFPEGLKPVSEKIEAAGYIPGLWIAPFIIDSRSIVAQEHPDWLLKSNGKLVSAGYNPLWGKNGTFYCLDLSRDDVVTFLDKLIERAVEEWGIRFLKLDFLYGGMLNGDYANGGAGYIWYNRAIKVLTARKNNSRGQSVCYLGCGVPFEQSFKAFPLSRIGCDTFEHWENSISKILNWNGRNSAYLNLKDTIGRAMWDKIIFANDPDVLFIRKENCTLTRDEKILIGAVDSMFGSQLMYSDDPGKSDSEEEIALAEEIAELQKKLSNEEFSVKNISADEFVFESKSGKIAGKIQLGKNHRIIFEKQ